MPNHFGFFHRNNGNAGNRYCRQNFVDLAGVIERKGGIPEPRGYGSLMVAVSFEDATYYPLRLICMFKIVNQPLMRWVFID